MNREYLHGYALAKKSKGKVQILETPYGLGDFVPVLADGTTKPRMLKDRFADVVNVKDFGAKGDGVTDDTEAIQAALNHGAGKRIVFPAATYKISASLIVREKSIVDGCNALLVPKGDIDIFTVRGAGLSEEVPIASEVGVGDTIISTATPHGLSQGDYALLWSQRDALSDAAGEYRLGYHQGLKCYFAEPVLIKSVVSDTVVETSAGLLFPGYRPDAAQDAESGRARATLSKLIFIEGVSISNFRVRHGYSGKVVAASFAKDLLISNISSELGDKQAIGVSLFACLNSLVEKVKFTAPETLTVTTSTSGFWKWTGVSTSSCWSVCVKDSTFNNEPNGIDFNFAANYWCSVLCTATNNTFYRATANAVTSHPGVWSNRFFQNSFVDCTIPATLRSRRVIFTGNEITKGAPAANDKSEVAVILQGSAIDSVVTHNEISGYSVGIEDHAFSNGVAMLPWNGNVISLNKIGNCNYGILASSGNNGNTDLVGDLIQGNVIDFSIYGIEFGSWRHGITAIGNILRGESEAKSCAFKIYGDSTRHILHDNTITRANLYQITFTTSVEYPVTLDAYNSICVGYDVNLGTGSYLNGSGYCKAGRRYERIVTGKGESSQYDKFPSGVAYLADKPGGAIYAASSATDTGSPAFNFYGSDAGLKATLSYAFSSSRLNVGLNGSLWFFNNAGAFAPTKDAAYSLGMASARVSSIFASTGSINTSDERAKSGIVDPDEALIRAWSKVNFRVFQFKDAVEKKGEDARLHVGVIAQQVIKAFASEGLDATRYGLLCYDKWQDEYEDVEVIDVPEAIDEEGNVTPAKTHIEHRLVTKAGDRYGIRYEEALALEAAYQRWRLSKIEAALAEKGIEF